MLPVPSTETDGMFVEQELTKSLMLKEPLPHGSLL